MTISVSTDASFSSGAISFSALRSKFKNTNIGSVSLSSLTRQTSLSLTSPTVPDATENGNIPTTNSNIQLSDYRGSITYYHLIQTDTNTNFDIGAQSWNSNLGKNILKKFYVNGTLGATSTANYAATFDAAAFNLSIIVNGSIEGAGGAGGTLSSPNGKKGGPALYVRSNTSSGSSSTRKIKLYNTNRIYAGGGGGGCGATGGTGGQGGSVVGLGDYTIKFSNDGKSLVVGPGWSGTVTLRLEWNDNPNDYGVALDSLNVGGQTWTRSGEEGSSVKSFNFASGTTYNITFNGLNSANNGGIRVNHNKTRIDLLDSDGLDDNASFIITDITNLSGSSTSGNGGAGGNGGNGGNGQGYNQTRTNGSDGSDGSDGQAGDTMKYFDKFRSAQTYSAGAGGKGGKGGPGGDGGTWGQSGTQGKDGSTGDTGGSTSSAMTYYANWSGSQSVQFGLYRDATHINFIYFGTRYFFWVQNNGGSTSDTQSVIGGFYAPIYGIDTISSSAGIKGILILNRTGNQYLVKGKTVSLDDSGNDDGFDYTDLEVTPDQGILYSSYSVGGSGGGGQLGNQGSGGSAGTRISGSNYFIMP